VNECCRLTRKVLNRHAELCRCSLQAINDADRAIVWRRKRLSGQARAVACEDDAIGEGAADIDSDPEILVVDEQA
jgi:hypothetical protein